MKKYVFCFAFLSGFIPPLLAQKVVKQAPAGSDTLCSAMADEDHRAIAGLSICGGQNKSNYLK